MKDDALRLLVDGQNPDGGWGAVKGRRSNTEATSLAIMALQSLNQDSVTSSVKRGIHWLAQRQNADASWPLNDAIKSGSWATALAILSLANHPGQEQRAVNGAKWALDQEGSQFGWLLSLWFRLSRQTEIVKLNPDLKGWSWSPRAFSWVEPTSYFLLAIKKLRSSLPATKAEERIRQGDMLLYDRMCEGGGWNYGNSRVLGETLWPYPDVTAVALLALQDHRGIEPNSASLRVLEKLLNETDSGFALSWGIICLSLYGHDVSALRRMLDRRFEKTRFLAETKTVALALLAMDESSKHFRL